MNYKKIIFRSLLILIYFVIWGPIAYSAVDLYTDMFFGSYIKNSQLAFYWSHTFFILVLGILVLLPPIVICILAKSEEVEIKKNEK